MRFPRMRDPQYCAFPLHSLSGVRKPCADGGPVFGVIQAIIWILALILYSSQISCAAEPDWFPLKSITPELGRLIVESYTQKFRPINENDVAEHPTSQPYFPPIISMWEQSIRMTVYIDVASENETNRITNEIGKLISFVGPASPIQLSAKVEPLPEEMKPRSDFFSNRKFFSLAESDPNILIVYSKIFGYRDPVAENPLQFYVKIKQEQFRYCREICRLLLMEPPEGINGHFFVAASNATDDHVHSIDQIYHANAGQECCRLIQRDGKIVGGIFYNNLPFPLEGYAAAAPDNGGGLSAGVIGRVLDSIVRALGSRTPPTSMKAFQRVFISPLENQARAAVMSSNNTNDEVNDHPKLDDEFGWEKVASKTGVCEPAVADDSARVGVMDSDSAARIARACLDLHRAVAAWNLLWAAGVRSGMAPDVATSMLLQFVRKER